jgi:hypothetical protein
MPDLPRAGERLAGQGMKLAQLGERVGHSIHDDDGRTSRLRSSAQLNGRATTRSNDVSRLDVATRYELIVAIAISNATNLHRRHIPPLLRLFEARRIRCSWREYRRDGDRQAGPSISSPAPTKANVWLVRSRIWYFRQIVQIDVHDLALRRAR